ncbi:putative teichuronic acid biosynthesis glycosyltransferase TuaC [subsurface metagenome]
MDDKKMKILLLNTNDISGGAAIAAYRLLKGLQKNGVQAQMLVQSKKSDDYSIIGPQTKWQKAFSRIRPIIDSIPVKFYKQRKKIIFSPAILPDNIFKKIQDINPDIIHLHWIAGGFIKIESLAKMKKPIVWTLHDMWAFSGGCHYDEECGKYINNCGRCPLLNSNKKNDLSYKIWKRKEKSWKNLDLTIVTVSSWLGECAKKSSLFNKTRVEVIPNGIDLNRFKPIDKNIARDILYLPKDKKIILFGALSTLSDKRKGYPLLKEALKKFSSKENKDIELVIFGSSKPKDEENMGFKTRYLGRLNDEISLELVYSAADVMIVPSIQDNLPNTVMESISCGTPVVAFNIGGIHDMIDHQKNGYLAKPFDAADLAYGIKWVLEDDKRWRKLSENAREKVKNEFDIVKVAKRYVDLYKNALKS